MYYSVNVSAIGYVIKYLHVEHISTFVLSGIEICILIDKNICYTTQYLPCVTAWIKKNILYSLFKEILCDTLTTCISYITWYFVHVLKLE